MEGHDLPRHEALQQDEATSAAHFRPAVLVPGVDVSHFHCAQVKREREREIEGERESGFLKTHRWAVLVPTSTQWGLVLRSDWLVTGDLVFSYAKCMFPQQLMGNLRICHRDIKPQNLLVEGHTHALKPWT